MTLTSTHSQKLMESVGHVMVADPYSTCCCGRFLIFVWHSLLLKLLLSIVLPLFWGWVSSLFPIHWYVFRSEIFTSIIVSSLNSVSGWLNQSMEKFHCILFYSWAIVWFWADDNSHCHRGCAKGGENTASSIRASEFGAILWFLWRQSQCLHCHGVSASSDFSKSFITSTLERM